MRSRSPDQPGGRSRPAVRQPLRAAVLLLAMMVGMLPWAGAAQAHGTVINPASRAYKCWQTWGNNHTNPAMQQQDPMCWLSSPGFDGELVSWFSGVR
ncbi:lytic polysaccharide monooxygenase [Micromonospora sp. S4605]|uniref:lytic polysaccharide monooxygenase n=1 Tax=Micromonospora sp. S4605 TaxID=1420897 RepID=UPI001E5A70B9|nr:lytic polysaccharide monooxygenase [Micromonospora sp. S4605]